MPREPATVKTTASAAGSTAVKEITFAPSRELDAGHAARRAALRADLRGRVAQQLGVVGDEDQVLLAGAQLDRADDPVARP